MDTSHLSDAARPGEHLQAALDEARRKAQDFRKKSAEYAAEANRWEAVQHDLEVALNKTRSSLDSFKTEPIHINGTGSIKIGASRVPRGYWWEQIKETLSNKSWVGKDSYRGPTKKELLCELKAKHPAASEVSIYNAINGAIEKGALVYSIDYLYLPEQKPNIGATA